MPGCCVYRSGRRIAPGFSANTRQLCISRCAASIVGVAVVFSVPMMVRAAPSAGEGRPPSVRAAILMHHDSRLFCVRVNLS